MKTIIIWICNKLGISGYVAKLIVLPENKVILETTKLGKDDEWHRICFDFKWSGEKKLYIDRTEESNGGRL